MDYTSISKIEKAMSELDHISRDLGTTRQTVSDGLKKLDSIDAIFGDIKKILEDSKRTINDLDKERKLLEEEKRKKEETISQLTDEQKDILERYAEIEGQLKKFSSIVRQFEEKEKEFKFEDVKAMLGIFTVLLEKIFQGQPHARILYTLHGGTSDMSRDQLKNATGISGAMVLRAVHELDKANLVQYNEDTGMVKLVVRIY